MRRTLEARADTRFFYRFIQSEWRSFVQQPVNFFKMAAKQSVKLRGILRLMIVSVPPEPVAPLRDHHFAESHIRLSGSAAAELKRA
ncbi:MAG: hypothetical protein RBG13Loki_1864 [Promethearchaeota archaeon CR_4]|nr:MAG: hypothetical protein RBG13Loki_1864 [Candidatus Lokiarchaeota archaeon CR_4]